jgi:uncharacterized protein YegL
MYNVITVKITTHRTEVIFMKKNLTELVFILDMSGSMHGLQADTIGGFNSLIEKQKNETGEAYVSTVLFNTECKVIHDRVPIDRVEKLTDRDYVPSGCTALLDAVGGAIHHIANIHRYAREEDVPEKTLFVITTDGMENASRRYNLAKVKSMIENERNNYGWEFIFLGANIDAAETAGSMGINPEQAVNYNADGMGTGIMYESVCDAMCNVRHSKPLGTEWQDRLRRDIKRQR